MTETKKYFGEWSSYEDMVNSFSQYDGPAPEGIASPREVIFALYSTGNYEGYATVLFERDGQLYEVDGSHCSCNGLEGQWEPAKVTWEALKMRPLDESYRFEGETEAVAVLKSLIEKHTGGAR